MAKAKAALPIGNGDKRAEKTGIVYWNEFREEVITVHGILDWCADTPKRLTDGMENPTHRYLISGDPPVRFQQVVIAAATRMVNAIGGHDLASKIRPLSRFPLIADWPTALDVVNRVEKFCKRQAR